MSYLVRAQIEIDWIGDGQGPLSVPSAQKLTIGQLGLAGLTITSGDTAAQPILEIQVPGANSPSQANFDTAFTALATALSAALAAGGNLARVQAFSTGGG